MDPKNPGAIDEIINLGEYWNEEELEKNKKEIIECNKEISSYFSRCYKFLKSAESIYYDIEEKYKDCMDFGKVNKLTENFIENIFFLNIKIQIKKRTNSVLGSKDFLHTYK